MRRQTMLPGENPTHRLWIYMLVIAAMWTIVVGASLSTNLSQQRRETLEVARAAARTAYQKDVTYRRWNAQHGGVYVPITEEAQPNPYLQEIAQRPINLTGFPSTDLDGKPIAPSEESGGLALTLINPAYMTRQVHELAAESDGVQGHITSLDPIRPANAPDAWERKALQGFEEGNTEASEIQKIDGANHMRLMQPLITEESCLTCHAEQGYEVGDIRGGISVSIPMASLEAAARKHNTVAWLGHSLLWIMGLAIIGGGGYVLQGNVSRLQESEMQYRTLIQSIQAAVIVHDADGRVITSNSTAQQLLGLPEEHLIGRPAQDTEWRFLREDGTPMPIEAYPVNQVFATKQPLRDLIVGIPGDKEKEIKWALVDADPVLNDAGEVNQVIVTFMDITQRKRTESVNEARLRIAAASATKSSEELMQMALDEIEALTASEVGFYHVLLDDQETLVLQAWSTNTLQNMCSAEGKGEHYPISEAGVWVDCVHEGRPVIHNDYASLPHRKGMPPGHAPIDRELVFPIARGDQIVAILGVGNKPTDYDQEDIDIISLLGDFSWEIFERKLTEEALEHSEEQYALALRAANAGSWDWDILSNELHWSEQIEPLFGFERGEFEGTYDAFLECVHPEDRQYVVDSVNICLEEGEDYAIEHRIVWPDGTVRWVAETGDVIRNNGGEPTRMLGVVQDITERKRAEQEVLEQKDMLENTLESLTYPFFVVNTDDYTIQMANSAAIPQGDLPETLTCHALTHHQDEPCNTKEHPCPLKEVLASKEHVMLEHIHYDANDNQPHYVEVHGYPIFDTEGNVVQMIEYVIDITERKLARKSLAEKKEALARSNAELEEFAYIASHDLQEPLRKVQAFGDRLQTKYGDLLGERGRDYLNRMQSAAERMRNLIDDLLTYSRVTTKANPFEAVDLNAVAENVISDLVVRIRETHGQVEVSDLPTVKADEIQIHRVLQNLIGNALKFHKEDEPPVVKVYSKSPVEDNGLYQIVVADNGIGFDKKYTEQIFAPFQRLHGRSEYEGTGMGLAICRKIVERHGGHITVESEPGQGTTFTITLPIEQPKEKTS